jgi:hypothetical protein
MTAKVHAGFALMLCLLALAQPSSTQEPTTTTTLDTSTTVPTTTTTSTTTTTIATTSSSTTTTAPTSTTTSTTTTTTVDPDWECADNGDCDDSTDYICKSGDVYKQVTPNNCNSDHECVEGDPTKALYEECDTLLQDCVEGEKHCQNRTTTTTNAPIACYSTSECAPTAKGDPRCEGGKVVQHVRWEECENPGTDKSRCVSKEADTTVAACGAGQTCHDGKCETTSTTLQSRPTTTAAAPPTTQPPSPTTSTTATSTSTTTTQPRISLVERLVYETPLELTFDVMKKLLDIIISWD